MREEWIASEGKIWVCLACGKTAKDKRGDPNTSWDEACFLNCDLFDEDKLTYSSNGRYVTEIKE